MFFNRYPVLSTALMGQRQIFAYLQRTFFSREGNNFFQKVWSIKRFSLCANFFFLPSDFSSQS